MESEVKLKRCPLCGSEAHLHRSMNSGGHVVCDNMRCGCSTGWFASVDDAVLVWNRRMNVDQFLLEKLYQKAMSWLDDANLISQEREYHGINVLVAKAADTIRVIGALCGINGLSRIGVRDGTNNGDEEGGMADGE